MTTPTVAIVGRPNVGKSTLFNRLVGRRQAIVHDEPGVTRDRIVARFELEPGRELEVIDTGGLVPSGDELGLGEQVLQAVEESDLLLLVVDGKEGLLPSDREVWEVLRPRDVPTILVVNKGDTRAAKEGYGEFYRLGIDPMILVSAEHAEGIGDLASAIEEALPEPDEAQRERPDAPAVAIVGRPNVGKSSLVNRLLGEPRVLVSEVPGTTRDPVDTVIEWNGKPFVFVDTAGVRRRAKTSGTPEDLAVMMARRQIERADLAVVVFDASEGVTSGDLAVAGTAWELGRSLVVVLNKWDLVEGEETRRRVEEGWFRLAELFADPLRVNASATTGRGVGRVLPAVDATLEASGVRLGTGELNRFLERAIAAHQPPAVSGTPWKLLYATQVADGPPTFMLFANRTLSRSHPYRRYLENELRATLGLRGTPVRLVVRRRS